MLEELTLAHYIIWANEESNMKLKREKRERFGLLLAWSHLRQSRVLTVAAIASDHGSGQGNPP